jgi:hypothetical protein
MFIPQSIVMQDHFHFVVADPFHDTRHVDPAIRTLADGVPTKTVKGQLLYPSGEPRGSGLGQNCWRGMKIAGGGGAVEKYFVAKVGGATTTYPFDASVASLMIAPDSGVSELSQLLESGFRGWEWIVWRSARHAKSKTYRSGSGGWALRVYFLQRG